LRCIAQSDTNQPPFRARIILRNQVIFVIFSIFGWKFAPSKKAGKPAAGKAADQKPARTIPPSPSSAPPAEIPQTNGEDSLDFSEYVPSPKPAIETDERALASAAAPVAATMPPEVDAFLSDLDLGAEPAPAEAIPPVVEEAATLFAGGQAEQALSKLAQSVRKADPETPAQVWLALFDLYQHFGMKEEFEALALEFVLKYERSPPSWVETVEPRDPTLATGGIAYFALGGALTDASAPELEKLRSAVAAERTVRVECGKLERIDGAGCKALLETLLSFRKAGKEVVFTGEARLVQFLEEACRAGGKETDAAVWALLFDTYRVLGLKDQFEEAAVNYAVTFEISPPSWESQPQAEVKRSAIVGPVAADQDLALSGELVGASEDLARQLQDRAAADKMLVLDMSGAKRVDLATADLMLNVLSKLKQTGAAIEIRGANELIRALLGAKGLSKVARIIPRK
jgi:ABC-type transporter Mla MlaB component